MDWEFWDENRESAWPPEPLPGADTSGRTARKEVRQAMLFAIAVVVLLAAGIGVVCVRNEAQEGIAEVEKGVQAAVDAEQWVQSHAPDLTAAVLADDASSKYVTTMVESERRLLAAVTQQEESFEVQLAVGQTHFTGRYAAAEVTLSIPARGNGGGPGTETVFRQTRFYRETPQGWLRTEPLPALWGEPRTLETSHLVWRYRQRDEEAVLAVAEEIDALYAQWRQDHGLAPRPAEDRLVVDVSVDYAPALVTIQWDAEEQVVVPSPAVYLAPPTYTDEEILAQAVALSLVDSLLAEMAREVQFNHAYEVLAGLRLWETMDAGLALSEGSDRLVGAYMDAEAFVDMAVAAPIGQMRELCATYGVWMISPLAIGVPVDCEGGRAISLVYGCLLNPVQIPTSMGFATYEAELDFFGTQPAQWGKTLFFSTVVDYSVTAYGRESLPALVAALDEHESWKTLVPAVYGVPFNEFEAGWREHLAHLRGGG
jgi:hypothetical protein